MSQISFVPGLDYVFQYPRHNFKGVLSKLEQRRIRVTQVRNLASDPLDPETFAIQPLLKRGTVLVTGEDLDKNAERSFYAASMRCVRVLDN